MMAAVDAPTDCVCGHEALDHGQERFLYTSDSRREVCLNCPGYLKDDESTSGYPHGKAWHRYRAASKPVEESR